MPSTVDGAEWLSSFLAALRPWIEPRYVLNNMLIGPQRGSAHFGEEKLNAHVKVKIKLTLEQATKAQRGSGGIAPLFL
jgi:hypothetical protein